MQRIVAFGEVLFDVKGDVEMLGGAPLNIAAHLSRLGNETYLITGLGQDRRGDELYQSVLDLGIKSDFITREPLPTGFVPVELSADGLPTYQITEGVAWDDIQLSPEQMSSLIREPWDCIIFGTLPQRTLSNRQLLKSILEKGRFKHVFFDLNIRQHFYSEDILLWSLDQASILKINEDEALLLDQLFFEGRIEANWQELLLEIASKFDIKTIILTLGPEGCSVFHRGKQFNQSGITVTVDDTIGAGDSFSAAFLHTLLNQNDVYKAAQIGIELGSYVASQSGAIPDYSDHILAIFELK